MTKTEPSYQLLFRRTIVCWCLLLYWTPCTFVGAVGKSTLTARNSTNTSDNKVCYPHIGCFSLRRPWTGFWRTAVPQSPDHIGIEFNLITRNTQNRPMNECKVDTTDEGVPILNSLKNLDYRNKRQITIVHIHGQSYSKKMKISVLRQFTSAYLSKRDVNLIYVQWDSHLRKGYRQNVANTRIVAAVAARFIRRLVELSDQTWNKFHLVGNSLGAHIAGYIGKIIPDTIHRITALEAAQPGFENSDPRIRLHYTDAHFVDALHTNARPFAASLGLGYIGPIGHTDFYFNGGSIQPACFEHKTHEVESHLLWNIKKALFQTLEDYIECSHAIVSEYWREALQNKCVMWGRPIRQKPTNNTISQNRDLTEAEAGAAATTMTNDMTKWIWDNDQDCESVNNTCSSVGWRTFDKKVKGVFHVKTNSRIPYCIWDDPPVYENEVHKLKNRRRYTGIIQNKKKRFSRNKN